jgi:transposase
MAMDRRWAQAPAYRDQQVLVPETLDDVVAATHPVRLVEQCLNLVDWRPWEQRYTGRRGQPPIHPRLMAGCILYGLMRGVRSSRELEDATRERVDFMWFLERRTIDHATFAAFRKEFGAELKGLNRQIGRLVCERYAESLLGLVLDGTRVRANSDRHGTRTAAGLDRLVTACVAELDRKLAQLAQADEREQDIHAEEIAQLRREVATLQAQVEKYQQALSVAQARDEVRQEHNGQSAPPVRVPVTDPDAQVAPNKEGGFAPNYTPAVGVDPASRAIVFEDVLEGSDEAAAVLPAVEAVEALSGQPLERVLADGNFASGANLEALESRGTTPYMPPGTALGESNPANRPDPTEPVAPVDWERLPHCGKYLAAPAFIYQANEDCYWCPMGHPLKPVRSGHDRNGVAYTNYACPGSAGCPLAGGCVKDKASVRTVRRDQYQPVRDRVGRRMVTEEGRAVYRQRAPIVEGVFAEIKHILGFRRFLLRGLEKVRIEWTWVCTAFNLKRLLALLAKPQPQASQRPGTAKAVEPGSGSLQRLYSHIRAAITNHGRSNVIAWRGRPYPMPSAPTFHGRLRNQFFDTPLRGNDVSCVVPRRGGCATKPFLHRLSIFPVAFRYSLFLFRYSPGLSQ